MSVSLFNNIKNHKKIISVYGLGNVGGSIAAVWLRSGAKVIGVDVSKKLLNDIKIGKSHKKEPFVSETFTKNLALGNFILSTDGIEASKNSHVKIISVPVGLIGKKVDLEIVKKVGKNIGLGLKKNDAVVLCPSVPPGTCEKILLPVLEKTSKLKGGKDFFLVYNPERIYEGRAIEDIEENYPAIVAGLDESSLKFGKELLSIISKKGVLELSSIAAAEAEKIFEGVYRDVNIALANQLADLSSKLGFNYWEARKAANSQPFCHLHYPGTGVGGFCIPVYPRFVIESGEKIGKSLELLKYSRDINDFMPKKCVKDALSMLTKYKKSKKDLKITILGLGFRGDVTDSRLSPTYDVAKEFLRYGKVTIHDPFIFEDSNLPKNITLTSSLTESLKNADLVFVSTEHKMYQKLKTSSFSETKKPTLIFDGRNVLDRTKIQNAHIRVIGMPFD
ncbi:nucleotide sugar dehydrogenase [Nitrosopumilus sp.]|uniref:nucleotide sugar dehydrogenase n=1 Tax=Nitrosopumilus sp. TaxID=2024843 RepID=UPI0034A0997C